MLRKLIVGAIVANFIFMLVGVITTTDNLLVPTFANTTISGPAYANVAEILELISGGIKQIPYDEPQGNNPWLYPNATNGFDFGTLVYLEEEGYLVGANFYVTLMIPVTSGRAYRITESGTSLIGEGDPIPDNAFLNIPSYQYLDELGNETQGVMPGDAFCGPVTSAAGNGHVVYEDGGDSGEIRIIRGIIAIGQPPVDENYPINYPGGYNGAQGIGTKYEFTSWEPVTPNQQPGDYDGSVTFTLSLI
ncbi:MAG: hypothetical protein ISS45_04430 [Candidatus Omnitrophica bacterium]|nr:hypothetical protein [Candidatus Omnitrophota bacterium]